MMNNIIQSEQHKKDLVNKRWVIEHFTSLLNEEGLREVLNQLLYAENSRPILNESIKLFDAFIKTERRSESLSDVLLNEKKKREILEGEQ